ncbi:ribosome-associated protein IOJAP [Formosa sp. Hel3_A1_48]|jgi:ribosome-associated protein|uniref:ribosome silencing factor n=1 Tax=Formosa sp. Hel3_A1_48 TaxID=1336795 RepID=UPI00084E0CC8|nr:ribosome silencing factor [Formosa sp. Hel3_A1_48]MDA9760962.1 ribosome silencing factor [Flavobacteriaceae bacterium]AOR25814.1 ribosome-associated protein IOJAP [Formosa sp. Hel3_A1_48]MDA9847031.1 ribosome silencing factor [Flavobacteriaceae bacterium]MDC0635158.1 ribosome silencing factor [Flavobacteriaceae bacterium]MDC0951096.1 ribosome silencing factor [Flavobacteriaceae bacterium]|tara:strand:+ start:501 stop:872 length:372 start_codon:yes stop_codon:yes gene_type:complete
MTKHISDPDELITLIIAGIEDIKGQNISILDLRSIENSVCDYFVICDGNSNTQVNAIVNSIQKKVSKSAHEKPYQIEGEDNAEWVLMDYINIVVHVFQKHKREYYAIENLWGDAKITEIETSY